MGYGDVRDISLVLAGYYMAKVEDRKSVSDCLKYIMMVNNIKVPFRNHTVDIVKLEKTISDSVYKKHEA